MDIKSEKLKYLLTAIYLVFLSACSKDSPRPVNCEGIHWAYAGINGPQNWNVLCEGYKSCKGSSQSPIDLKQNLHFVPFQSLKISNKPSSTHILNNGHTLQFTVDSGCSLAWKGIDYDLQQFHFHTESEHTLDNVHYPMELHMVHRNQESGNLVVIAVLFKSGAEHPFLSTFLDHLPVQHDERFQSQMNYLPYEVLPAAFSYYFYNGSLTTPPCSEIVEWIIVEQPMEASSLQIQKFRSIMGNNFRPVAPIHGRILSYSKK